MLFPLFQNHNTFLVSFSEEDNGVIVSSETQKLMLTSGEEIERTATATMQRSSSEGQVDISFETREGRLEIQVVGAAADRRSVDQGVLLKEGKYRFMKTTLRIPPTSTPIKPVPLTSGELISLLPLMTRVEQFFKISGANSLIESRPFTLLRALNLDDSLLLYIPSSPLSLGRGRAGVLGFDIPPHSFWGCIGACASAVTNPISAFIWGWCIGEIIGPIILVPGS